MHDMLKCLWQETSQWPAFKFVTAEGMWCLQGPHGPHLAPWCSATQMGSSTDKLLNSISFHRKQWELVGFCISQDSALKVPAVLQFHPLRNRRRKRFVQISTQSRQQHLLLVAGQGSMCQRLCRMHFSQAVIVLFPGVYSFLRCPGEQVFGRKSFI